MWILRFHLFQSRDYNAISRNFKKAGFIQNFLFKLNTFIEKKYSHVVVLNATEAQYYKSGNVQIIPNAIEIPESTSTIERKNIIIAAGRIAPVKQFDQLIKAWTIIEHQFPNWEVHIYGEGDALLTESLKNQINECYKYK